MELEEAALRASITIPPRRGSRMEAAQRAERVTEVQESVARKENHVKDMS